MTHDPPTDGHAIVYCDGHFGTPLGKIAHGLVQHTRRYRVLAVIDRRHAGADAHAVLGGAPNGIPVVADLDAALAAASIPATHLVIGLAPETGPLTAETRAVIKAALAHGLHVDSGLHDLLGDDPELVTLAHARGLRIRDVSRSPARSALHAFTGRIEEVGAFRVAILGTDAAVGKRTTAWLLRAALRHAGYSAELIGTGQTSWFQGARHSVVLDGVIHDFVTGELEHTIVSCWEATRPDVMVLEGQGSLMNPMSPGGLELLAAARPHAFIFQHAPARLHYTGSPRYPLHDLDRQIRAIELLSEQPVLGVAVNHEGLDSPEAIARACADIELSTGLPAEAPLAPAFGLRPTEDEAAPMTAPHDRLPRIMTALNRRVAWHRQHQRLDFQVT
jgi:uncharacterized NAD-dependent epimerase/dehydratase family protein